MRFKSIIAGAIAALSFIGAAVAQPSGGPGPRPSPYPWVVNGAQMSYSLGGVTLPAAVTGGQKGTGTINISGGYYLNNVLITSGTAIPLVAGASGTPITGTTTNGAPLWNNAGVLANSAIQSSFTVFTQVGGTPVASTGQAKMTEVRSVFDYGATCDGSGTGDQVGFANAIASLAQGTGQFGGTVRVPYRGVVHGGGGGCILTSLNLNAKYNITIEGDQGNQTNGGPSLIYFSGTPARFVDARDSHGVTLRNLVLAYTSSSFTGILVDAGGNTPAVNPTTFGSLSGGFRLENSRLYPVVAPGTATLLNVDQAQLFRITNNQFYGGKPAIRGALVLAGSSTTGLFQGNTYNTSVGVAIDGCGDSWTFIQDTFEPSSTGNQTGFGNSGLQGCRGLSLRGVWSGDYSVATGTFMEFVGRGLSISGGRITGTTGSTFIKMLGASSGININGMAVDSFLNFIDFNSQAVAGVNVNGVTTLNVTNKWVNDGSVTGFAMAEGNSPSTSRAAAGQLLIGQALGTTDAAWTTVSGDMTLASTGVATLRPGVALSVIGRSANSTGAVADISTTNGSNAVLRESGGVLGFGAISLSAIPSIPLTKLSPQATNTIVANATSGSAVPTAVAVGSCSTASSALQWVTDSGPACNTSITANTSTNIAITNDAATNATMFLTWVTANTGNLPLKTTSSKFTANPAAGSLAIGNTARTDSLFSVEGTILSGTTQLAMYFAPTFSTAATGSGYGLYIAPNTAAGSYTQAAMFGIRLANGTKGAGMTVTTEYKIYIESPNFGSTVYSIYSAGGRNYFAGGLAVGGADADPSGGLRLGTAATTLTFKQGGNGAVGTLTCLSATNVTTANTFVDTTVGIILTYVSGTQGATPPFVNQLTAATSFRVACASGDTAVYNYQIVKSAA